MCVPACVDTCVSAPTHVHVCVLLEARHTIWQQRTWKTLECSQLMSLVSHRTCIGMLKYAGSCALRTENSPTQKMSAQAHPSSTRCHPWLQEAQLEPALSFSLTLTLTHSLSPVPDCVVCSVDAGSDITFLCNQPCLPHHRHGSCPLEGGEEGKEGKEGLVTHVWLVGEMETGRESPKPTLTVG